MRSFKFTIDGVHITVTAEPEPQHDLVMFTCETSLYGGSMIERKVVAVNSNDGTVLCQDEHGRRAWIEWKSHPLPFAGDMAFVEGHWAFATMGELEAERRRAVGPSVARGRVRPPVRWS